MPKIRILADGASVGARNQKRGKLFELLMATVLRGFGYRIDRIPSTNYAGMEIDIEGTHLVTDQKLYCECKCYDSEVDAPKLQAFFGKYMALWLSDKTATGLFIAIPGINSHAKGFYNEKCGPSTGTTTRVHDETDVINSLVQAGSVPHEKVLLRAIPSELGAPGESIILVTEEGNVVVQRVVPAGSLLPSHYVLFDSRGGVISDTASIDKILELEPELRSFEMLSISSQVPLLSSALQSDQDETVVEVRGGSECFEYQLPASPEHFIGRKDVLSEIATYASQIISNSSSVRGFLLEANSGWGKSSSVLACANSLRQSGHLAIVIDSRSALSAQFILRVVEYSFNKLADEGLVAAAGFRSNKILGFDDAADQLISLGNELQQRQQVLFLFLDQFENLFFLPDAFRRIRDLFLKVSSASTGIA